MLDTVPIIDAHHHLWDPTRNYHPWLVDEPPIAFRYGDYTPIRRAFLPEDYRAVTGRFDVVASVTMEGEWDPRDPLGESRWIERLAREQGMPDAHVAQAWLDADDADAVLTAQAALPLVRGVRHKPRAAARPTAIEWGAPGSMSCPRWQAGYARLAPLGLRFDLQVPWWHLREALALAERFPDTPIILDHTGLPADRSAEGLRGWATQMRDFSRFPGAWVKISGLGLAGQPWRAEDHRVIIRETIEWFGIERCLFASNFPVDRLCGTFETIYAGYFSAVADCALSERQRLFHDNAIACYALDIPRLSATE